MLGDALSKRIAKAAKIVIEDSGVDALLVIITPQAMTNPTDIAQKIIKLGQTTSKPILAAWIGGLNMREGINILNSAGIPAYQTSEQPDRSFTCVFEIIAEQLFDVLKRLNLCINGHLWSLLDTCLICRFRAHYC